MTSQDPVRPLRLLVVDDHEVVRRGLVALLDRRSDFEVVAEAPEVGRHRRRVGPARRQDGGFGERGVTRAEDLGRGDGDPGVDQDEAAGGAEQPLLVVARGNAEGERRCAAGAVPPVPHAASARTRPDRSGQRPGRIIQPE